MHKRHAPSDVAHLSKCGYEVTPAEYASMKKRGTKFVNCKKCLRLLQCSGGLVVLYVGSDGRRSIVIWRRTILYLVKRRKAVLW